MDSLVHMSVGDTVGLRHPAPLLVLELVEQRHALHQVAPHAAHYLVEIIHVEAAARQPEAHVLVARREFRVGHEGYLRGFAGELLQEPLVRRPEQANVRDLIKAGR